MAKAILVKNVTTVEKKQALLDYAEVVRDALRDDMWILIRKLTGDDYNDREEQLNDAVEVGSLAETIQNQNRVIGKLQQMLRLFG